MNVLRDSRREIVSVIESAEVVGRLLQEYAYHTAVAFFSLIRLDITKLRQQRRRPMAGVQSSLRSTSSCRKPAKSSRLVQQIVNVYKNLSKKRYSLETHQ